MAQYFTDFSEYSIGSFPSDWNTEYSEGGASVISEATATGGTELDSSPFFSGEYAISWSIAGNVQSEPVQIYSRLKSPGNWANVRVALCGSGDEFNRNSYELRVISSGPSIIRYVNDSFSNIASASSQVSGLDNNQYYHFRFEKDGSTLRAKLWQGTAEPYWQVTATDTLHSSGWVGIHTRNRDNGFYDVFSVGTAGDPAPTSPVTSSIPAAPTGLTLTEL